MPIADRFKSAWNAFRNDGSSSSAGGDNVPSGSSSYYGGITTSSPRRFIFNDKSIIGSIYTRLSIDVASVDFKHVQLDASSRYLEDVSSDLNSCFTRSANLDQGPRAFRQDIALTLFDKGVCAIVPVDTTRDPNTNDVFDVQSLRVGEIVDWYASQVRVSLYNERTATRQEVVLDKTFVAIVYNPLYSVMNEPSSTLQRLLRKLTLLDGIDEQSGSGRLDLIIQLPYAIKSEAKRDQAEKRRQDIEFQLKDSQYGIAYADATEKITQLNRPTENNLLKQIEYLTKLLYEQLGLTEAVMNGTADETSMRNYQNRTVEPIVDAIKEAMQRSFIGSERAKLKEQILYFMDPFKLVPVTEIAEIADKFARNEILTANEIRGVIGFKPSAEKKADQLINSNMPQPTDSVT